MPLRLGPLTTKEKRTQQRKRRIRELEEERRDLRALLKANDEELSILQAIVGKEQPLDDEEEDDDDPGPVPPRNNPYYESGRVPKPLYERIRDGDI